MSNFLWPHGLQQPKLLCPPLSPGVHSNSRSLSRWCHPTISSSVVPFSSCPQAFPASGSFPVSHLFESCGQSIGASASTLFFQWIPRTGLLKDALIGSPYSPRDSQESSPIPQFKSINSLALSFLYGPTLTSIHDHWENHTFDYTEFVGKVIFLLFDTLSRLVFVIITLGN